jgi:5-methyltetrahydrofolate--homocysteine methyltransferase
MADLEALKRAVMEGRRKEAMDLTQIAIDNGADPQDLIDRILIPALNVVGDRFQKREIFVPEMMIAAKSMQSCVDLLKPLVKKDRDLNLGTVVVGTVFGDLHDIGKNLVRLLLESSGFRVVDLGVNVVSSRFIEAVRNDQAAVVGLSSLLTTGDPHVEETVNSIKNSEIGGKVRIICGGAAMTRKFVEEKCGADAYAKDAASGVKEIKRLLGVPV